MLTLLLALMLASQQAAPQQPPSQEGAYSLEGVEVRQRRIEDPVEDFVSQVAAPNRGRSLARWTSEVCVGAVRMRADMAQYLVDRVSTVAEDMGLRIGEPGCTANIVVIAADDPDAVARELTTTNIRAFRPGGVGMDAGPDAMRRFQTSDSPVRWWSISTPVDGDTGASVGRLPGQCTAPCMDPATRPQESNHNLYSAPIIKADASLLRSEVVDNLVKVVVILDVNQMDGLSLVQLSDYVAMIALAQVDPEGDFSQHNTILNVFQRPDAARHLTDWDTAYLQGLYGSERTREGHRAYQREIADRIRRDASATAPTTP